jgi:hypothetical protein
VILSLHVPKAAGNSLREMLHREYGERFMGDYGDWSGFDTPEANARRAVRTAAMRARAPELEAKYDLIHGHFHADKYLGVFGSEQFVAFFREPYQQAMAHYFFLLRNPQRDHPEERLFHENRMTLLDYLSWDAFRNQQSQYLGSVPIEDFTMVGLSNQFSRGLRLFNAIFGRNLGPERFANVNARRQNLDYEVEPQVRAAVEKYRAADIELYRRAQELFERQARSAGV